MNRHTLKSLKLSIQETEKDLEFQKADLREQIHLVVESIKPIHLLKKSLGEITSLAVLNSDATDALLGYSAGFVARKLFSLAGKGPLVKVAAKIIELIVAAKTIKNAAIIKSAGANIVQDVMNRRGKPE